MLTCGQAAAQARASTPTPALAVVHPPEARAQATTAALLSRYAEQRGLSFESTEQPFAAQGAPEVARAELELLREVERALLEARELNAELRERAALRVLSAAEEALLGALALPGAHAFLAEVYLQLALCAAQHEELGLFESALSRALSLDGSRRVEAAEAPPAVLQRARALASKRDLAPLSELRVEPLPKDARVWLDGVSITAPDLAIRASAGVHVLVVRAPGHAPYASLLQLAPGRRPALRVVLSPRPDEAARAALLAAEDADLRQSEARHLARARGEDVYLFELGRGKTARALVMRCSAELCSAPAGLDARGTQRAEFAELASARAWLSATRDSSAPRTKPSSEKPLWKRWPLWTGTAALLLAGAVTAVLATRDPQRKQERSLEIDATALPR